MHENKWFALPHMMKIYTENGVSSKNRVVIKIGT
jgi:hypothetical protein